MQVAQAQLCKTGAQCLEKLRYSGIVDVVRTSYLQIEIPSLLKNTPYMPYALCLSPICPHIRPIRPTIPTH